MNTNVEMPKVFHNILPVSQFSDVCKDVIQKSWIFQNRSYDGDNVISWTQERKDRPIIRKACDDINLLVNEYLDAKFLPVRIHYNGQTFGQNGAKHQDYYTPGIVTLILYVNTGWNYEWGGETYVIKDSGEPFINPVIPNTGLLLPSNWFHWGCAPSITNVLRITVAFTYVLEEIIDQFKQKCEILLD